MRRRAGVIVCSGDEILLIQRIKGDRQYWVIPGGGIDEGETSLEAACRELREELELVVQQDQLRLICQITSQGNDETYYQIEIEKKEFVIHGEEKERSNEKNVYIPTWIRKDELQELDLKPEEMKMKLLK